MRWAVTLVLAAAALLATVGLAAGSDVLSRAPDPNPAEFRRGGAPVYTDAPDGWACHYLGTNERLVGTHCAPPHARAAHGPPPAWHSRRLGEPIDDVLCQRGWFSLIHTAFSLIHTAGQRVWVASTDIRTTAFRRDGRNLVDGCDAFTWS
jgi:hypothetical protein